MRQLGNYLASVIAKSWDERLLKKRAEEIRHEFYSCKDPDKALELIRQLSIEHTEWLERGVNPEVLTACLIPAWEAAKDALDSVEAYFKSNPPDETRAKMLATIKEALYAPDLTHNRIIRV